MKTPLCGSPAGQRQHHNHPLWEASSVCRSLLIGARLLLVLPLLLFADLTNAEGAAAHQATDPQPVSCQDHPNAARLTFVGPQFTTPRCFAGQGDLEVHPLLTDVIGACAGGQPTLLLYDSTVDPHWSGTGRSSAQIGLWVPMRTCRLVGDAFAGQIRRLVLTDVHLAPDERGITAPGLPTGIGPVPCQTPTSQLALWWDQGRRCQGFAHAGQLALAPSLPVERVCSGHARARLAFLPDQHDLLTAIELWGDPGTCVQVAQVLPMASLQINQLVIFPPVLNQDQAT